MEFAILCGNDQHLLESRASVLRTIPIETAITHGLEELENFKADRRIDLVVLCHSLSNDEQRRGNLWVQEYHREAKVIVLTSGSQQQTSSAGVILNSSVGPAALVQLCRRLLERSPQS